MQDNKEKNTRSRSGNSSSHLRCYSQNKLNAIIGKSVKVALKSQHKEHAQHKEHNVINEFDALSLSSSDDNDISCT
eukprot:7010990-Ditylum_brightwellii.AAC.1